MKTIGIIIILVMNLFIVELSVSQEIKLDSVEGTFLHNQPDTIMAGSSYVFHIRYINPSDSSFTFFSNGFRVYSPDGAIWSSTTLDTSGSILNENFDIIFGNLSLSVTGSSADTIGVFGSSLHGTGIGSSFNEAVYTISIGPIPSIPSNIGKNICLDSASFVSETWKWSKNLFEYMPSWDGPYCFTIYENFTDVVETPPLPNGYTLYQNYPNPFNPTTTIKYELGKKSDVLLTIYNVQGQIVKQFEYNDVTTGEHEIQWDASSEASGVYFYKLKSDDYSETKKMILLK